MNLDDIEKIVKILKQSDISDFELEQSGVRIKLSRVNGARSLGTGEILISSVEPAITPLTAAQIAVAHQVGPGGKAEEAPLFKGVPVKSPIVGTFYRKSSPDTDPFVREGSDVKKGDTLCIVEAMKLMNEIEAPCSGKVEKIFSVDGSVVEYGEVLFTIIADS